jgi:hypothetical protein
MKITKWAICLTTFLLLTISNCTSKGSKVGDASQGTKDFGVKVVSAETCTEVKDFKAIASGSNFEPGKVYFLTKFQSQAPTTIYHRYAVAVQGLHQNIWREIFIKELKLESTNWTTWTYINADAGNYMAFVLAEDKTSVLKSVNFSVRGESVSAGAFVDSTAKPIVVEEAVLALKVEKMKPVLPEGNFKAAEDGIKVYIYVVASVEKPTKLGVRYSKKEKSVTGEEDFVPQFTGTMDIKGKKWTTWFNLVCTPGSWQIDLIDVDGKTVLKSLSAEVVTP